MPTAPLRESGNYFFTLMVILPSFWPVGIEPAGRPSTCASRTAGSCLAPSASTLLASEAVALFHVPFLAILFLPPLITRMLLMVSGSGVIGLPTEAVALPFL